MRTRLCGFLVLASAAVVGVLAPGGAAKSATPGDGCLVVSQGLGRVTVSLSRGVMFGKFGQGTLKIDDTVEGDGSTARVYGAPPVPSKLNDHRTLYSGDQVRFRTTGAVRISVTAQFIDLSVVGKGAAWLSATSFDPDFAGRFSVDTDSFCEDNFQEMPATATKFQIASPIAG